MKRGLETAAILLLGLAVYVCILMAAGTALRCPAVGTVAAFTRPQQETAAAAGFTK